MRVWPTAVCSLCAPSLHTQASQLCRGAGNDNPTMLLSCYISALTNTYQLTLLSPGPQMAIGCGGADLRIRSHLIGWSRRCMRWWWRLWTLCCGLFLSCRLLCSHCSRMSCFELLLCASRFYFVLRDFGTHMHVFLLLRLMMIDSFFYICI